MKRLLTLFFIFTIPMLAWAAYSADRHAGIAEARNLATDARTGVPIMLLMSQDHCPYCVLIKREIINPLILSGDYENELVIRELFIDLGTDVTDFQGKRRPSAELAHEYGADLTPTLLFLGPEGEELTERIIGITSPELFPLYLEAAIKSAITALKKNP
ncbi:thioredoxin family protein [Solemya velesiana gill symbiont]|uniref:Thioredoxin-like fold domain-containing protein n=1 Tax=Solemya velesiana gill symbiont TaxID=1918948 RepID=A0A1T2KY34_9GAMM|nr:thioredoxin fold domain-containing protein [Solemya velesiana gill symbiont]OOZ37742.1 hypothetical protein BOW51_01010 [Solemya velesiana gill symbiont]